MAAIAASDNHTKASIVDSVQPKTVVDQLAPSVVEFTRQLPAGYSVAVGGSVEDSAKSQGPIAAVTPLMLFIMATILMISWSRAFTSCSWYSPSRRWH